VLLGAVVLVLLIASANIGNLLLARAVARRREVAVRRALGAGHGRLVRQFLTESALLGLAGGVAGLLVAFWATDVLNAWKPQSASAFGARTARIFELHTFEIGPSVLLFNMAVALVTGMLFGLAPALRAARADVQDTLRPAGGDVPRGPMRRLTGSSAIVAAQVALALVLLVGAGLMLRTVDRIWNADLGFEPDGLVTARVELPSRKYRDRAGAFYTQVLEQLRGAPGVRSASIATATPLSRNSSASTVDLEPAAQNELVAGYHLVDAAHFTTLRLPLVAGRPFGAQDREGTPRVALVSETAAKQFWPGRSAVGQRLRMGIGWEPETDFAIVIGVVGDVRYGALDAPPSADVYFHYEQFAETAAFLIVRTGGSAADASAHIAAAVRTADPAIPVFDVKTMTERIGDAMSRTRFSVVLLATFAGLALLLAAIGVGGVVAYSVAGRTREIGVRMALGATSSRLVRQIVAQGLAPVVAGLLIGLAAAAPAGRALQSQLYGVASTDVASFAAAAGALTIVAALATYIPARRAALVDPITALRTE
jgi:predicted permease